MQPCEVCGGMGIDAAGYCTNCRAYRGIPGQAPYQGYPQQQGYPPQPQQGYPATAGYQRQPGYGAYPTSGAGPAPGYGAPQPPPPKQRSSFTVPLIALSVTLVVLVVSIVAVVLIRDGGDDDDPGGLAIDQCVVGTWEVTDYSEDVSVPNVGPVKFTDSGKGATIKFGPDGKGVQDFGNGTDFVGTVQGVRVNLTIEGTVKYDYSAKDGTVSYRNLVSDGKATVSAPTANISETEDFKGSSDPSKYNCSGDSMTMSTSLYSAKMRRTSKDV